MQISICLFECFIEKGRIKSGCMFYELARKLIFEHKKTVMYSEFVLQSLSSIMNNSEQFSEP